jgi:ABC-type Fe3+ transport system substrate-binding protein
MGLALSGAGPGFRPAAAAPADILARLGDLSPTRHMEALVAGARTEGGRVVWFAGRNLDEVTQLIQSFRARYPFMTVDIVRVGEGAAQRILTEFRAGAATADVVDLNAAEVYVLNQAGALASYRSPETAQIPSSFKDPKGFWTVSDMLPEVIGYNTRQFARRDLLPRTFQDLASPRWKGILGRTTVGGPRWVAGMVEHYGERRGLELVRAIAQNTARLYTSNTALGVQLSQGEIGMAYDLHITVPIREKGRGAPVDFYALDELMFADPSLLAITANTHRPLGAALLLTWLLSAEGQWKALELTDGSRKSTRTDVPYPFEHLFGNRKVIIYGPDLVGPRLARFQQTFNEIFVR